MGTSVIEIILGALCLAAGLALTTGAAGHIVPLSGLDFIIGILTVAFGSALLVHGTFRRVRDSREGSPHGLSSRALMLTTLLAAALIIILDIGVFGQITVSGRPVGYHLVAEGLPLALFVLLIAFNRKQAALDRDGVSALARQEQPNGG